MLTTSDSLLRLDAVRERTGLGRSTLYALIQRGSFPKPIAILGTRISAWPSSAVDAWVARQIEEAA